MQAVVKIGKSQYLVTPGEKLLVDRAQVDQVLLVIDEDKVLVGQPEVTKAVVTIKDLGEVKGDKIRVSNYKAKSRSRRTVGFRPRYHQIEIQEIKLGSEAKPKKDIKPATTSKA
ncbi:MAG: 50S ribosomal protein L21 [bacterium]|nr:50S ribosomal protein L21 [bacterium]